MSRRTAVAWVSGTPQPRSVSLGKLGERQMLNDPASRRCEASGFVISDEEVCRWILVTPIRPLTRAACPGRFFPAERLDKMKGREVRMPLADRFANGSRQSLDRTFKSSFAVSRHSCQIISV